MRQARFVVIRIRSSMRAGPLVAQMVDVENEAPAVAVEQLKARS